MEKLLLILIIIMVSVVAIISLGCSKSKLSRKPLKEFYLLQAARALRLL